MAALSAIGRVISGLLADRWGEMEVNCLCLLISGISCLTLWIVSAKNFTICVGFAIIYGLSSGGFIGLYIATLAVYADLSNLVQVLGLMFLADFPGDLFR